ncbi:capsule assembly Wzi family protein [Echinicola marina]|uniref:capsule assembly Wzi family protein n=1 Tax=Echinicola marina TaxID=2859768 RepID=UPI001CF63F47|nr:capsule assembly Wzi family protein [Echinicola marina]UCS93233.1 capsule assembly Wzi family protein [Echinicola marina]
MLNKKNIYFLTILFSTLLVDVLEAQTIPAGFPVLEESLRRKQLLGELDSVISFNSRPLQPSLFYSNEVFNDYTGFQIGSTLGKKNGKLDKKYISYLPIRNTIAYNSGRPYGWGNGAMIPNVGFQNMITGGIAAKFHFVNIQLMPEWVWTQNKSYDGYYNGFSDRINRARYYFWNFGDNPERFGNTAYSKFSLGQSKITLSYGSFEIGASTENIWWGPGQFNALIFSNNAEGFPHLTFNATKPVKTFLGSIEGQLIMGKLQPSGYKPSQWDELNDKYFVELSEDWRYLNGISISYQPKWVSGLFLGLNRTYQQYSEDKTNSFGDWFPIFETFTKSSLFNNGNSVDYDGKRQDQQVSIFGRYLFTKANAELYFEYGRRDHAYTAREFVLNPEHARAYLLGFQKLFELPYPKQFVQVRAEMLQQQESINRWMRYPGLGGGTSWQTHYQVRGFTHVGQALGSGAGVGSNVQTIEVSIIDQLNKYGIVLERLANHQDFYYKGLGYQEERQPWVDLSLGFLFDYQWDRFMLSSRLQFINGMNYQWQLDDNSTEEFPVGKDKFSVFAQAHLIYLLK